MVRDENEDHPRVRTRTLPSTIEGSLLSLLSSYGSFAFGLVTLIVIWRVIIHPELNSRKLEFQQLEAIITEMRNKNAEKTIFLRNLQTATEKLERSVDKILQSGILDDVMYLPGRDGKRQIKKTE